MMEKHDSKTWAGILFNCRKCAGLRGDDFLWHELEEVMATRDQPTSTQEFNSLLMLVLEELEVDLESSDDMQLIERYPKSGMSGGYIHLDTWRYKNIPLLQDRFATHVIPIE
jgi:hypothetical protein